MDTFVDFVFRGDPRDQGAITHTALIKGNISIEGVSMAAEKIVENDNLFAPGPQTFDCHATDIAGPASN